MSGVVCLFSPVGKMAMQLVAAQMMTMVWNGPSGAQLMKTSAVGHVIIQTEKSSDFLVSSAISLNQSFLQNFCVSWKTESHTVLVQHQNLFFYDYHIFVNAMDPFHISRVFRSDICR